MGTQYSSDIQTRRTSEGIQFLFLFFLPKHYTEPTMNMFVIAAACLVAAVSAEADPWYGYGYGGYLHQQAWPAARGPGFEGTCYGCRVPTHHFLGKREAEAEPHYGYGAYGHGYGLGYGYGGYGYARHGYYGHHLGKRSAEPFYGYPYAYGYGFHPYALRPLAGPLATSAGPTGIAGHGTGTSYVARSPQGLRGKRSAEPYYGYGFYGYPYGYRAYGPGIAGHPGAATSFVHRSPQGLGK